MTSETLAQFSERTRPFLEADEVWNALLIGFLNGRVKLSSGHTPFLWAGSDPVSLVAATTGQNLLLSSVSSRIDPEILRGHFNSISKELLELMQNPPGVIGPATVADVFVEVWIQNSNARIESKRPQGVYVLQRPENGAENLRKPPKTDGQFRLMTVDDISLIGQWLHEFSLETLPHEATSLEARTRDAVSRVDAKQTFILETAEGPVATASLARPSPNGYTVNAVYTPKTHRNRGYASAITFAATEEAFRRGKKFCTLFTDLANPTSNGIYRKLGYEQVGEFSNYRLQYS